MEEGANDCLNYCSDHYGADRGMQFDPLQTKSHGSMAVCSCDARNNTPEYFCTVDESNHQCVPTHRTFNVNCWTVGERQHYCTSETIDYATAKSRFATEFAGKAQPSLAGSGGTGQPPIEACNGYKGVPAETAEGCGTGVIDPRCQYSVTASTDTLTVLTVSC
jgi:hypothetical protein